MNPLDKYIINPELVSYKDGEARVTAKITLPQNNPVYQQMNCLVNDRVEIFVEAESITSIEEIFTKAKNEMWQGVKNRLESWKERHDALEKAMAEL